MAAEELLTAEEHEAIKLTSELSVLCGKICGNGPASHQDYLEFVTDIHNIQSRIERQAAARAYPDMYRLLGG